MNIKKLKKKMIKTILLVKVKNENFFLLYSNSTNLKLINEKKTFLSKSSIKSIESNYSSNFSYLYHPILISFDKEFGKKVVLQPYCLYIENKLMYSNNNYLKLKEKNSIKLFSHLKSVNLLFFYYFLLIIKNKIKSYNNDLFSIQFI
jgi:hypothetical protein